MLESRTIFSQLLSLWFNILKDGQEDFVYQLVIKPKDLSALKACAYLKKDLYAGRCGSRKVSRWLDGLNRVISLIKGATGTDSGPKYYSSNVSDKTQKEAVASEQKSLKSSAFDASVNLFLLGDGDVNLLRSKLTNMASIMSGLYQAEGYNNLIFKAPNIFDKQDFITCKLRRKILLTGVEIASLYHLPVLFDGSINYYAFSNLEGYALPEGMSSTEELTPDFIKSNDITLLGKVIYQDEERYFGQKWADRVKHTYLVGQTGTGKTTMLYTMIMSDIVAGRGVVVVDPHGDLAKRIIDHIPADRKNDLVYFNPAEDEHCLSLDIFEAKYTANNDLLYSSLMSIFKRLFDSWSESLEYVIRNALIALLENNEATMADLPRLIDDEEFRRQIMVNVKNEQVKKFWLEEFNDFMEKYSYEDVRVKIKNKLSLILSNEKLQKVMEISDKTVKVEDVINNNKIFVANLGLGNIGEELSRLFGRMLTAKLQVFAMSQTDKELAARPRINLYLDEFQNFMAKDLFAKIISEARKFNLNLTIANQYLKQLDDKTQSALLANVGTLISFKVANEDWYSVKSAIFKELKSEDLENLECFRAYAKILHNNKPEVVMMKTIEESELENKLLLRK